MRRLTQTTGDNMTGCHHYIPATVNICEEEVKSDEIKRISTVVRREIVYENRKGERKSENVEDKEIKSELESARKKSK